VRTRNARRTGTVAHAPGSEKGPVSSRSVPWGGETLGEWTEALEGADVLIKLAGRSVNCRYTPQNQREILASRVRSTQILGEAIRGLVHPPKLWMNASTATIYRHSFELAQSLRGILSGDGARDQSMANGESGQRKFWRNHMSEQIRESQRALTPVAQKFILHWGEMGTKWGINRTVAQVHALLFLSPKPLPADVISDTLSVARSNVSTSLRELQGWGIVRVVHVLGDRRDHFETAKDVWEIFRTVSEERKRREIDPTLRVLNECVQEVKTGGPGDPYTRERLESMLEFLTTMSGLFDEMLRMPMGALKGVGKLRGKVITLLGSDKKKAG